MAFHGTLTFSGMIESEHATSRPHDGVKASEPVPEAASFELLIHQHQAKLYNFIYRYTRNRQDAEDLLQDTFIKAFRNFDRYDSKYAFSAWLYTIARRTVFNHFRGRRETESINFELIDPVATPNVQTEALDTKRSIWKLAKGLKVEYQEVLVLKYADDLSVSEIALIMGKSQVGIKTLLFRARQQLRKIDHHNFLKE